MKRIYILYNQPLSSVQGINYVNSSFVQGNKYLKEEGLVLDKIIGCDGVFDCKAANSLDTIGASSQTMSGTKEGGIKKIIKNVFSKESLIRGIVSAYSKWYKTARNTLAFYKDLEDEPDYIIFQDPQTALYFFKEYPITKIKTILILHCSDHPMEQDKSSLPGLFKCRRAVSLIQSHYDFVMNRVDKVVYLSQHAVEASVLPIEKKTYIFNGEEDLPDWHFKDVHTPYNMVCVGSMAWRKGQDVAIQALAKLSPEYLSKYILHLIGAGPQMEELKTMVTFNKLEYNVKFYGSRNDVPDLLEEMDLFILPSLSEGLPMSMIEALRQGTFVIATATGAIPEMINDEIGIIVERNADSIAEALRKCVDEGKISKERKLAARKQYLDKFTLNTMMKGYASLLKSL